MTPVFVIVRISRERMATDENYPVEYAGAYSSMSAAILECSRLDELNGTKQIYRLYRVHSDQKCDLIGESE